MELRPLVMSGGALCAVVVLPFVVVFALAGHPDLARGVVLGLAVGLLNSLLLARKMDRVIDGRDPWQTLTRSMPRNMMQRFGLIFAVGVLAARVPGIHLAGMAGGLGLYLVVSLIYVAWTVTARWRKEDGTPVYG